MLEKIDLTRKLPKEEYRQLIYGEMAIYDRSWYGWLLVERVERLTPEKEWRKGFRDIVGFERTLETAFVHLAGGSTVLCD